MQIVSRNGSFVKVRDKFGKLWLTRRKKLRHDSRRRKNTRGCTVVYIPIHRIPETGDWLFTCSMKPLQFSHILPKTDREQYPYYMGPDKDAEWEQFANNDFCTLEGSHHAKQGCGFKLISDKYAEFFNYHKLWELFELNGEDWDKYIDAVKAVCAAFKIEYEGI